MEHHFHYPTRGDPEDRSLSLGAAEFGCSVEVVEFVDHETCFGVQAIGSAHETMEHRLMTIGVDHENGSLRTGAALCGCAKQSAEPVHDDAPNRSQAIRT